MRSGILKGATLAALMAAGAFGVALTIVPGDASAVEFQTQALDPDGYVSFGPLVNGATMSFLRFVNVGSSTSTIFSIRYFGFPSGVEYTSDAVTLTVEAHASPQKSYLDLSAMGTDLKARDGDTGVIAFVKASNTGTGIGIQHVTYNIATGYFENASVCTFDPRFALDTTLLNGALINVHSTTLSGGSYPSTIILNNPAASSRVVTGIVYKAATGQLIGTFPATTIPANGSVTVSMASVQKALNYVSTGNEQFNIVFSSGDKKAYSAIPTHAVMQTVSGATFNLTIACPLNPAISSASAVTAFGGTPAGSTISTKPSVLLNPSAK